MRIMVIAGAAALALGGASAASALQMQTYYSSAAGATTLSFDRFSGAGTLTAVEIKFFSAPTLTFNATFAASQSSASGTITGGGVTYSGLPGGSIYDDYVNHGFFFAASAGTHSYTSAVSQGDTRIFANIADFVGANPITISWTETPLTYVIPSATSVTPTATSFAQPGVRVTYTYAPLALSAAPEPAGWLMLTGGFGLLGAALRRREAPLAMA